MLIKELLPLFVSTCVTMKLKNEWVHEVEILYTG